MKDVQSRIRPLFVVVRPPPAYTGLCWVKRHQKMHDEYWPCPTEARPGKLTCGNHRRQEEAAQQLQYQLREELKEKWRKLAAG